MRAAYSQPAARSSPESACNRLLVSFGGAELLIPSSRVELNSSAWAKLSERKSPNHLVAPKVFPFLAKSSKYRRAEGSEGTSSVRLIAAMRRTPASESARSRFNKDRLCG